MAKTVVAMYKDFSTAQRVIDDLQNNGFDRGNMDFYGGDRSRGSLISSLTDAGVSQSDAQLYAQGVDQGDSLVMLETDDHHADQAAGIMDRYNPLDLGSLRAGSLGSEPLHRESWQGQNTGMGDQGRLQEDRFADTAGTGRPYGSESLDREELTDEGETHIPIVQEEMRVGKREVQKGGVRVHSRTTEQPFEETHHVRDESINVERRPADRPLEGADLNDAFRERTFEVSETDEELVTEKRPHVVEDVVVSKSVEERPETVRDTLRKTEVETEDLGSRTTRGSRDFASFDSDFQNHYDTFYGTRGRDYSYYQPGYRYGYDLAGMDRYRGRKWSELEPDVRREWDRTHPGNTWDDFRDSIRYGWERASGMSQDTGMPGGTFNRPSTDTGYGTGSTQEGMYPDQNP